MLQHLMINYDLAVANLPALSQKPYFYQQHCDNTVYVSHSPRHVLTITQQQITLDDVVLGGTVEQALRHCLTLYPLPHQQGLPDFQTGWAGVMGYAALHNLEHIPHHQGQQADTAQAVLCFYDVVLAINLQDRTAVLMANAYPDGASQCAADKLAAWQAELAQHRHSFATLRTSSERSSNPPIHLQPDMPAHTFQNLVRRTITYIQAGDIYQANIAQSFHAARPTEFQPYAFFQELAHRSPAPWAGYFCTKDVTLVSNSPEHFFSVRGNTIITKPIKGTRPRLNDPVDDLALQQELLASPKERAENLMIVDLLRNDLMRVCTAGSVVVTGFCDLESYQNVHHLVSTITGRLRQDVDTVTILTALFPGGSITGAPKIRAQQIIAELEPVPRDAYCGSMLWISNSGRMDSNILIRTVMIDHDTIRVHAGCGIVADADPVAEYAESMAKVSAIANVLANP